MIKGSPPPMMAVREHPSIPINLRFTSPCISILGCILKALLCQPIPLLVYVSEATLTMAAASAPIRESEFVFPNGVIVAIKDIGLYIEIRSFSILNIDQR